MCISISPIDIRGMYHDVTMLPSSVRGTAKLTDRQRKMTEPLKSCSQQGVIQDQP